MQTAPLPGALASAARWGRSLATAALGLGAASLIRAVSPTTALRIVHATCARCHRIFDLDVSLVDENHDDDTSSTVHANAYGEPPYVFIYLNQTSLLETFLLPWLAPRPYRIIVNLEYALLPVFGWSSVPLGARVVVRQWPRQAKRAIRRAIDDLRGGDSYIISIEGQRSPDGALQPYKKGAVVMAIEASATIIPVLLRGADTCLPYGAWRVRPGAIELRRMRAIETRDLNYEDRDALIAHLRALAQDALAETPPPVEP